MTDRPPSPIDEAAAGWWLKSHQGLSPEQRLARQAWLEADPAHARAFAAMQSTAARLEDLRQARASSRKASSARPGRPALLAMVCCALLGAVVLWQQAPPYAHYEHRLARSTSLQTHAMPDGSRVLLDQASEAEIRFDAERREVLLRRGQALFDVSKDSQRPFTVSAGDIRITVLGTRFSVRHEVGDIRVEVASGQVRVSDAYTTRLLAAGEGMRISSHRWLPTRQLAVDSVASWQHRQLVFDNTPLGEALAEFSRYGAPPVALSEPSLEALRVNGSFRHDQPQLFLRLLPEVLPVKLQQHQGQWQLAPL